MLNMIPWVRLNVSSIIMNNILSFNPSNQAFLFVFFPIMYPAMRYDINSIINSIIVYVLLLYSLM